MDLQFINSDFVTGGQDIKVSILVEFSGFSLGFSGFSGFSLAVVLFV